MPSSFRRLEAYRRASELASDLHARVVQWSRSDQANIGWQLIRAADSVGAKSLNRAVVGHTADKRRFLFIARGSLYELEHWLLTAESRGLLELGTAGCVDPVAHALNGLIRNPNPEPVNRSTRQPVNREAR